MNTGQITPDAAELYEEYFSATGREWATHVADTVCVDAGQSVLDVACGTGFLAREIAPRVGPTGTVTGVDINEGMLSVARTKAQHIEWMHGAAEHLPFDDGCFDVVVSQFGLMFFEDRERAVAEIGRVTRPSGKVGVAVWDSLENIPGWAAVNELVHRHLGGEAAQSHAAPFVLGNREVLKPLFTMAGMSDVKITTRQGVINVPSIEMWLYGEIEAWVLASTVDEAKWAALLEDGEHVLRSFVTPEGSVSFAVSAHILTATKIL